MKRRKRRKPGPELPSLAECERAVEAPASEWKGRCHEVACVINRVLKLGWEECYGAYLGPVAPGGFFDSDRPIHRHGWLLSPDGRVFDPTRFVFENRDPYLYFEHNDTDYDFGMERVRLGFRIASGRRDPPEFDPKAETFVLDLSDPDAILYVTELFGNYPTLSFDQLLYLANLGPSEMSVSVARALHLEIERLGQGALIPFDFRNRTKR